jgi:hypothetical protein
VGLSIVRSSKANRVVKGTLGGTRQTSETFVQSAKPAFEGKELSRAMILRSRLLAPARAALLERLAADNIEASRTGTLRTRMLVLATGTRAERLAMDGMEVSQAVVLRPSQVALARAGLMEVLAMVRMEVMRVSSSSVASNRVCANQALSPAGC